MEYSTDKTKTQSAANSADEKVSQNKARELTDNRPVSVLQRKNNNTGLPDNLKSGIENLSGHSMDDVKVHYNSDKPAQLNAHAYAQGSDIHLASGQEKHLPHEAWHVVQQKQGRVKPTLQMKGKVNVNDDKGLESEADIMGAKAIQFYEKSNSKEIKLPTSFHNNLNSKNFQAPIQAIKFNRTLSFAYHNSEEENLIKKENEVTLFFKDMQQYAPRFPEIMEFGIKLTMLKMATIDSKDYHTIENDLQNIKDKLDVIATKIAYVGAKGGDHMMAGFGKSSKDSKVDKIVQIFLNTISLLPETMQTKSNEEQIRIALYPDGEPNYIGYDDKYMGDSDVEFAQKRHLQVIKNLYSLNERIHNDWPDLQIKFGLKGAVDKIELTGSDLHKGGLQVVIVKSEGGQQVVYKPRSTAPDAALLDNKTGIFASLNKKGAELSTMGFHESKEEGSYVQFINHDKLKSTAEIKKYYSQLGQLAVAAKLFGVNDLHYENIMAASHGPTIIDGETSFLMNIMTEKNFQSTGLQKGIFEHVSEIDSKLSNNSFYTQQEMQAWENLPSANKLGWDQYIGEIRDADVKSGGTYESDFKTGIAKMLAILKTNRKLVAEETHNAIQKTNNIRVVPLKTGIFKILMNTYRDHLRENNEDGLNATITNSEKQVTDSLRKKEYFIHQNRSIRKLLKEDFEAGDIPILNYDGKSNQLKWNNRVVAKRKDHGNSKKVVNQHIKWILSQTVDQITESIQK